MNGWGVLPPVSTHRYLNTLNETFSLNSRIDPNIKPFSFISGIIRSNEEFTGLNLTLTNNTQTFGNVLVDYSLTNRSSLAYFKSDTFLLS